MMSFSEDTDFARSIPARIASYSVSILEAGKSSRMACSILSPLGALSCKPNLAPVWREASSTLRSTSQRYLSPHLIRVVLLKNLLISVSSMSSKVCTEYRIHLALSPTEPSFLIGQACV